MSLMLTFAGPSAPSGGSPPDGILLEDGVGFLLLESGSYILLES